MFKSVVDNNLGNILLVIFLGIIFFLICICQSLTNFNSIFHSYIHHKNSCYFYNHIFICIFTANTVLSYLDK